MEVIDAKDYSVLIAASITSTPKFLRAVILGIPILKPSWIVESLKAKKQQQHEAHMLDDKAEEERLSFRLSESLERARKSKLMAGCYVYISFEAFKTLDIHGNELTVLSGGECIEIRQKKMTDLWMRDIRRRAESFRSNGEVHRKILFVFKSKTDVPIDELDCNVLKYSVNEFLGVILRQSYE